MKKASPLYFFCLLMVSLNLLFISCGKKEEVAEKPVKQISDKALQEKNVAVYKTREVGGKARKHLSFDLSQVDKPASLKEFVQYFHFPPIRQHRTGTCWCFSTTSFFESETKRLGKDPVKLSELYTVYWEFVEKARHFIRKKGDSFVAHGSEHNAVIRQMKKYGAVRASDYTGLLSGQTEHDHGKLLQEIRNYLQFCKDNGYWDEEKAISYVKSILNKHLGKPPETIEVDGRTLAPKEYLDTVLQLPLDDYVAFISFKSLPFYTKGEFKVPDNWWHSKEYHNVPLDDFYSALVDTIKSGYTAAIGGDISEPGISGEDDVAIVPTFDIPQKLIDQDSREFRFTNRTSTDDHAIHVVGYKEGDGHAWFLIKDSGSSAQKGQFKGYYLYRDDYVKLKILTFMVHKDAVASLLGKFPKEY